MSERGVFPSRHVALIPAIITASRWRWRCSNLRAVSSRPECLLLWGLSAFLWRVLQVRNLRICEDNSNPVQQSLAVSPFSGFLAHILWVLSDQVCADALLPSFTMPTLRHFWKRQYWQRLRLLLSTGQFLLARHTYLAFFCTVRCGENKPIISHQTQSTT